MEQIRRGNESPSKQVRGCRGSACTGRGIDGALALRSLGLKSTFFANPHGLQHNKLRVGTHHPLCCGAFPLSRVWALVQSTARDVARLVCYAMHRWPLFQTIVSSPRHTCFARALPARLASANSRSYPYQVTWNNTNALLGTHVPSPSTRAASRPSSARRAKAGFVFHGVKTVRAPQARACWFDHSHGIRASHERLVGVWRRGFDPCQPAPVRPHAKLRMMADPLCSAYRTLLGTNEAVRETAPPQRCRLKAYLSSCLARTAQKPDSRTRPSLLSGL